MPQLVDDKEVEELQDQIWKLCTGKPTLVAACASLMTALTAVLQRGWSWPQIREWLQDSALKAERVFNSLPADERIKVRGGKT